MIYNNIKEAVFLERLHRFGALVDIDGTVEYVHVKNTGRCRELFLPGVHVYLEKSNNPERKTKYSLISVSKGNMLINIDSQVPNKVVYDALVGNYLPEFQNLKYIKREVTFGSSRFDLYYERNSGAKGYIEVKGVTLDDDGTAMFPDAPTARGRKHLLELVEAKKQGYEAHAFFLIQYKPVKIFIPNEAMDPKFSKALRNAAEAGVNIHAYDSIVTENSIYISKAVSMNIL